ncbi:Nepenthesin [Bertholletia excelsa]
MASPLFLLFSSLLFFLPLAAAAKPPPVSPLQLVLPVTKDASTLQYYTQFPQRTPAVKVTLTVDVGGPYMWVDCDQGYESKSYKASICESPMCRLSGSSTPCGSECYGTPRPGCNNNTCSAFPCNPIANTGTIGEVATDIVSVSSADGRAVSVPNFIFVCGSSFLAEGLLAGAKGMAGFGITNISLPVQFAAAFGFSRKFALCLSSVPGKSGVIFVGDGSYLLPPNTNASTSLMYTPLIHNPVSTACTYNEGDSSFEYLIGVTSIAIAGKPVKINTTFLTINEEGYGGTKISTVDRHTVMETSIYKAVTEAFVKELKARNVTQVKAVQPFKLCYDANSFPATWIGPEAPRIDLVLHRKEVVWRILGSN